MSLLVWEEKDPEAGSFTNHALDAKFRMMVDEFGANPTLVDSFGRTVLHLLVSVGACDFEVPSLLRSLVAKPNAWQAETKHSGSCANVINAVDKMGMTPLHAALSQKRRPVMLTNSRTRYGSAAHDGLEAIVGYLLTNGADPMLPSYANGNALRACEAES